MTELRATNLMLDRCVWQLWCHRSSNVMRRLKEQLALTFTTAGGNMTITNNRHRIRTYGKALTLSTSECIAPVIARASERKQSYDASMHPRTAKILRKERIREWVTYA